mgnify:CR=1 FL=1
MKAVKAVEGHEHKCAKFRLAGDIRGNVTERWLAFRFLWPNRTHPVPGWVEVHAGSRRYRIEAWTFDRPGVLGGTKSRNQGTGYKQAHAHVFDMSRGRLRERTAELAALLDLSAVLDRRAESLPLGIRQRLSLAVALIHEPDILILDEPTSGVDPVARNRFWRTIVALARERGVTIFVSTHYLSEAARCDRLALMNAGRVLAVDQPEALVRSSGTASLEAAFIALIEKDMAERPIAGEIAA